MKKYFYLTCILASIVSCRKDRTCNCTTSVNGGPATNSSFVAKNVTKKEAKGHYCIQTSTQRTDSTGTTSTVVTCTLAK